MALIDEAPGTSNLPGKTNCNRAKAHVSEKSFKYNLTSAENYGTLEFRQTAATNNEDTILN